MHIVIPKQPLFIPISLHSNTKGQCQRIFKLPGYSNYHTIALISYVSKVMLKLLQARLHSM